MNKRHGNPHRITFSQWMESEGYENMDEALEVLNDSVVPALCNEGCEVEPDGVCEHGCPSALLAMGLI